MNKKLQILGSILFAAAALAACGMMNANDGQSGGMMDGGMMGDGGMMRFHSAPVPDEYASLQSPVDADDESIARGEAIYIVQCATCHGDGGMGDGPAGAALDPSPAPIAHTSQMMSDAYLFWRISEGGVDFGTAMIPFKNVLSEQDRWDVINYVRALGSGQVMPHQQFGGATNDPAAQATQQADMLASAVEQGVLTQAEADLFAQLHAGVDAFIQANRTDLSPTEGQTMMQAGLAAMVEQGVLTADEAEQFQIIHDKLSAAGFME